MKVGLFDGGRLGVVKDGAVIDVSDAVRSFGPQGRLHEVICGQIEIGALTGAAGPSLGEVRWQAPLPRPGKIIGAPANYYDHVDEMPNSATIVEWGLFLKAPTSIIGPHETVKLPYTDKRTDYEGELAVVVGRAGRNIALDDAMDHVFGYTCLLDITVRSSEDRSTRKSFDTFTPLGPFVVTRDELTDPSELGLALTVNGDLKQAGHTSKLIYGVRELIAYASSVFTLEPGDIIATGTPAGVGPLSDGDVVSLQIEHIGSLSVSVTSDGARPYASRPGPASARPRT